MLRMICKFYILFSRVLTSRGRIVILTSSAMNNFINRICSEQSDSSKAYRKDAVEGNSVEKTNKKIGENGLDCGLINNTVTENLSELTDDKDKVDITDDKCESMRTNKIAVSHEAFPALDSSEKISNKKATDIVQDSDDSSHNLIINLSGSSDKTESEVIKTDHVYGTEPKRPENETKINGLIFLESNYVKLGETHAYICVLEKSAVT